ncbi:hypothetical protein [Parasphingorhabdus flavimaris]|uniref:hypothetical protein n=1 Tax=Parasphingorhabdus flavimaris TaxID=266812 RepID=UPI003003324F
MTDLTITERFLLAFKQLTSACNDNPQTLVTFFKERPQFTKLAWQVDDAANRIEKAEAVSKMMAQVSPEFIKAWKAYLYTWRKQINYVVVSDLKLPDEFGPPPSFEEYAALQRSSKEKETPDPMIDDSFVPEFHDGGKAVAALVDLVLDQADFRRDDEFDDSGIANTYEIGAQAIDHFEQVIGIDIQRAFDRWDSLPAVFVPKHVSDKHGLTAKDGLFALFGQAVRAYVAGAPAAAVALCRALLETVLRDHYLRGVDTRREDMKGLIDIAVARYDFLQSAKLNDLRLDANKILHRFAERRPGADDDKIVLGHLKDLKHYIEKAPES